MPKSFKRYGFAAAIVACLGLMALAAVGKGFLFGGGETAAARAPGQGQAGAAPQVRVALVAPQTFSDAIQALGTAQAKESVIITPKVSDAIRTIRFESGQRVRAGQVLVEMSRVEQQADLAEATAAREAAERELARFQEVFNRGFAPRARLDAAKAAFDAADARVRAGQSRIADRTIRAPFSGVMGLRTASPGQYVSPGERIGTLDDVSEIKLDFDVAETQIALLRPGVAITARTAAFPDRKFEGEIAHVDSRIAADTRTLRVRALLPNRDEILRPGMLMTVEIRANPRQALAAPEIAILDEAGGAYVFRVARRGAGLAAERVRVQTGLRSGGLAEVTAGLRAGDRVIVEGVQMVRPGQPVRVQAADAPPLSGPATRS